MVGSIEPNEVLLKLSVYDNDKSKLIEFSKGIAPLILSGPPGVAVTGGRPRVQNVMSYWPALISKELLNARVSLLNDKGEIDKTEIVKSVTGHEVNPVRTEKDDKTLEPAELKYSDTKLVKIKVRDICLARSGDKGDMSNIGVVARSEEIYTYIKEKFTAKYIKDLFKDFCKGKVIRYEMDNLLAINFLLEESLDGGGTKSLMIDAQGKMFASALLNQEISVPEELLKSLKSNDGE
jgi:hypothetical protein